MCHSDVFVTSLEKLRSTPLTLGHEGIGRVEAVGRGGQRVVRRGDRAGMTFLGTDLRHVRALPSGRERFAPSRRTSAIRCDGALAEYAVAPAAALVRVPADLRGQTAGALLLRRMDGVWRAAGGGPGTRPDAWRCSGSAGWDIWRCRSARHAGLAGRGRGHLRGEAGAWRGSGGGVAAAADIAGPTLQKEMGRGGRGDRADTLARRHPAGVQIAQAARDAGAGRDFGEPVRTAAGRHGR